MLDDSSPLPGAPDPWESSHRPEVRPAPPFLMTEMIAAEPVLASRIARRLAGGDSSGAVLARVIREVSERHEPIVVTGCGTSEHAAQAVAEILRDGLRTIGLQANIRSAQAFEASLEPVDAGLVIAISHEGGTRMTNAALEHAQAAAARTALITVSDRSPGAALADIVVTTEEQDQSWCHTVGYVSPIVAAAAIRAHLSGVPLDAEGLAQVLASGQSVATVAALEAMAANLADRRPILVVASGWDRAASRELVLKIEEGAHIPAVYRDLETMLHGHLAATDVETGLVLLLAERRERAARIARARGLLRAVAEIGVRAAAFATLENADALPEELVPAGLVVLDEPPASAVMPAPVAALLATATPLQILAERLARARGVNPDAIRRDEPAYQRAGEAAETAD